MSPVALVTADLDQNRRLEVEAALVVVLDTIAVFPRREPSSGPLTGIDPKTRALDVLVIDDRLAVAGRDVVAARVIRNFDDFPEELVRRLGGVRTLLISQTPANRVLPGPHPKRTFVIMPSG